MALCHFYANEYARAFTLLTESLMQQTTPKPAYQQVVEISIVLLNLEFESLNYQLALQENTALKNTHIIKLRIRKLLVDACL